jgi:hypothetical protein
MAPLPLDFGGGISISIEPTAMLFFQAAEKTPPRSLPAPVLTLLDLDPAATRRTSSHATIVAYLLSLAQAHLRFYPDATEANPFLIAIRYKISPGGVTSVPVFVIYTAHITRRFIDDICGDRKVEAETIVLHSPPFDCTDKEQMADFAELLLELCPALVLRAVQELGGEKTAVSRAEEIRRVRNQEWIDAEDEIRRRMHKKKRNRSSKKDRPNKKRKVC